MLKLAAGLRLPLLVVAVLSNTPLLRSATADGVCPASTDNDVAPFWVRCGSSIDCDSGRDAAGQLWRTWVWALRHGEAEHNLDPVHGWKIPDPGLTKRGWRQAAAAGDLLPYGYSHSR